jgi:hypothetical protein
MILSITHKKTQLKILEYPKDKAYFLSFLKRKTLFFYTWKLKKP